MTDAEFRALTERRAELVQIRDQAIGALEELKKQLHQTYGCRTAAEAREAIAREKAAVARLDRECNAKAAELEKRISELEAADGNP